MHIKNFDPFDFKKKEINGVPVYYKNIPWTPCIHVRVVFNSGAFSDPVKKEGVAHFLEHTICQGPERFGGKKGLKEWSLKNVLNSFNAMTNFYTTHYEFKCLPTKFEKVISDLKDIIFNSSFKEDAFELEKKVIIQEAWRRYENEKLKKFLKESVHNLGHGTIKERFYTALGWPETIEKITMEDLKNFYKENYVKENMFIILAGNIESKNFQTLKKFLHKIPENKKFIFNKNKLEKSFNLSKVVKPLQNKVIKNSEELGLVREQAEYEISLATNKIKLEKNWGTSKVFARFLQNLLIDKYRYDNGLCYNINTSSYFSKYDYNIGFNLKLDEKNISIVENELENTFKEILSDKYLKRFEDIKQALIDQIESDEDNSYIVVSSVLNQLRAFDKIFTVSQTLQAVKKVTYSDIKIFLKTLLKDREYIYTEIILPSKKENEKK